MRAQEVTRVVTDNGLPVLRRRIRKRKNEEKTDDRIGLTSSSAARDIPS